MFSGQERQPRSRSVTATLVMRTTSAEATPTLPIHVTVVDHILACETGASDS